MKFSKVPQAVIEELLREAKNQKFDIACHLCSDKTNKLFKSVATFKNHLTNHQIFTTLECPEKGCQQKFNNKNKLRDHVSTQHSNTIFKCILCNYQTNRKANLKVHLKGQHVEELKKKEWTSYSGPEVHVQCLQRHLQEIQGSPRN